MRYIFELRKTEIGLIPSIIALKWLWQVIKRHPPPIHKWKKYNIFISRLKRAHNNTSYIWIFLPQRADPHGETNARCRNFCPCSWFVLSVLELEYVNDFEFQWIESTVFRNSNSDLCLISSNCCLDWYTMRTDSDLIICNQWSATINRRWYPVQYGTALPFTIMKCSFSFNWFVPTVQFNAI